MSLYDFHYVKHRINYCNTELTRRYFILTISTAIIDFLSHLHGLERGPDGSALDLSTGLIMEADENFPDGEMLRVVYQNGMKHTVPMNRLVDVYLLRHANAMSITEEEGGGVKEQYEAIVHHFTVKTGFDI